MFTSKERILMFTEPLEHIVRKRLIYFNKSLKFWKIYKYQLIYTNKLIQEQIGHNIYFFSKL